MRLMTKIRELGGGSVEPPIHRQRWAWACTAELTFCCVMVLVLLISLTSLSAKEQEVPIVTEKEVVQVDIPYEIVWKETDQLVEGEYGRETEGKPGKATAVYWVTRQGDEILERELFYEWVSEEPVNEVRLKGTWPADKLLILEDGTRIRYTEMLLVEATAYSYWAGGYNVTATGKPVQVGYIAVDPTIIPYHTRMFVKSPRNTVIYGECVAEDCGGAIKGMRIDLFMETEEECNEFGRRPMEVYILPEEPGEGK